MVPKLIKLETNPNEEDESKGRGSESQDNKELIAIQVLSTKPVKEESSTFSCDQCDFKTELAVWLENHKKKGHAQKTFHCTEPDCYYQITLKYPTECKEKIFKSRIKKHIGTPHYPKDKYGYYHCPEEVCKGKKGKLRFKNKFKASQKFRLLKHLKSCKEKANKEYVCEVCAKVFMHERALKGHLASVHHSGEASFVCYQNGCGYQTNDSNRFKKHVKNVHEKIRDLACEKCPYRTSNETNLRRHMMSHMEASDRKFFGCILCDSCYSQKVNLRIHMKQKHKMSLTGKTPYTNAPWTYFGCAFLLYGKKIG